MSARIGALLSLMVLGITAVVGGAFLVYDPSGEAIQMPVDLLKGTPFEDFLIPGLILLVVLGINSLLIGALVWRRGDRYAVLVAMQGTALAIWIVTQMIMIGAVNILHFIYLLLSIIIMLVGWRMWVLR